MAVTETMESAQIFQPGTRHDGFPILLAAQREEQARRRLQETAKQMKALTQPFLARGEAEFCPDRVVEERGAVPRSGQELPFGRGDDQCIELSQCALGQIHQLYRAAGDGGAEVGTLQIGPQPGAEGLPAHLQPGSPGCFGQLFQQLDDTDPGLVLDQCRPHAQCLHTLQQSLHELLWQMALVQAGEKWGRRLFQPFQQLPDGGGVMFRPLRQQAAPPFQVLAVAGHPPGNAAVGNDILFETVDDTVEIGSFHVMEGEG